MNPAPAKELPDEIYPLIDIFIPNEEEAVMLAKHESAIQGLEDAKIVAKKLAGLGVRQHVIITLGKQGALIYDCQKDSYEHIESLVVKPVDTTGAGRSLFLLQFVVIIMGLLYFTNIKRTAFITIQ